MVHIVTITKGRFTIPIKIRRELGLEKGRKLLMNIKDNKIILKPLK